MFRFPCSVVLQGGRGTADKCHWPGEDHSVWGGPQCVGRTRSVPATLGLPPLTGVCFPCLRCSIWSGPCVACGSSFWVFHKSTDSVGPAFCAFLRLSSSGSQELEERTLPGCDASYPLHRPSLSFRVRWCGAPCVCSWELVSSCNPPSRCQQSRISGSLWLETGSLFAVW